MSPPAPLASLGFGLVPRLLGYRLRMVVNGGWRAGRDRRGWTLIGIILAAGLTVGTYRLTQAALSGDTPSPDRLHPVISGALGMIAGFSAVTAITFALSAFYFAKDLEILLTAPIPPRAVLLTKLCVQLLTGIAIGSLLAGPPLLAYLVVTGHPLAILTIGLATAAMAAIPLALGTGLTIAAVRLLPARRVRDAGGLLVTVVVFSVTGVNLLLHGAGAFTASAPSALDPSRQAGLASAGWLPTGWAARSVDGALHGDPRQALIWCLPLVVAALVLLPAVALLGERAYLTGYQRSLEAGRGGSRRTRRATRRRPRTGVRPVGLTLALKDLREIRRDASQLGQLLLPLALFALYIAAPGHSAGGFQDSGSRLPAWFGTALTAGFASLFAASGVALRGVGLEGRRLWVIRTAPVDVWSLLLAKFAVGVGIAAGLGLLLLWIGALRNGTGAAATAAASVRLAVVIAGLVGLATGMGALRPRLDWTDPRRSIGVGLSISFLALGSVYLGLAFVDLALPYAARSASASTVAAADLGLVLLAGITTAAALMAGAARLRVLEL